MLALGVTSLSSYVRFTDMLLPLPYPPQVWIRFAWRSRPHGCVRYAIELRRDASGSTGRLSKSGLAKSGPACAGPGFDVAQFRPLNELISLGEQLSVLLYAPCGPSPGPPHGFPSALGALTKRPELKMNENHPTPWCPM